MQKVHSLICIILLELPCKITNFVCSLTVLYTIAYVLYLVLEEGSPWA